MNDIHVINLSQYTQPKIVESKRNEWVEYGENNKYYDFLIDCYQNSTTNNACINNISRLIYGNGLSAKDAGRKPNEYAQMKMLFGKNMLRSVIMDLKMLGNCAFQLIYTKDRKKIAKVEHIPMNLLRPEKCDEKGKINAYYYSDNWEDIKRYAPTRIPTMGTSSESIEVLVLGHYSVGQKYFSFVDYLGALDYCVAEEEIALYLINEIKNSFSGTKVINFNGLVPTEEQQQEITTKVMGKLTGSTGQKVIVSFNNNKDLATTVEDISLTDAPEHYSWLATEARDKILNGHNVTSSMLVGINQGGQGFSSTADEIKVASVYFYNTVIRPFQDLIINGLNQILAFNGISLDLKFESLDLLGADIDSSQTSKQVIEAINSLSPLVANKVLDTMTPNEVRALVGLLPETGGSDLQSTTMSKIKSIDNINIDDFSSGIDLDEWELIDTRLVDYDLEDEYDELINKANEPTLMNKVINFVKTGTAYPRRNSEQDNKIFRTRYRYIGEVSDKSRAFCKAMIKANKLYRKEDIVAMENQVVNEGFGPNGADNYSIWLYKGGGACHHAWQRETYRRKGTDISSPLAVKVTPAQQRKEGFIAPVNDNKVYQRPIDMPNKGFLPK
jgi:hypothetical protein